jgi:hypothetical protein
MSKPLSVGPKSAAWLRQVGIRTHDDLAAVGAVGAFVKCKRAGFKPSLNLLYSLEGVLLGCHWQKVPEARRAELAAAAETEVARIPPTRGRAAALVVGQVRDVSGESGDSGGMDYSFGFDEPSAGGDHDGEA